MRSRGNGITIYLVKEPEYELYIVYKYTKASVPVSGCPNLTNGQCCDVHATEQRRQYDKYERNPNVHKKYGRGWSRIRNRYIIPIIKNGTNEDFYPSYFADEHELSATV